jgi:hypothetical protein
MLSQKKAQYSNLEAAGNISQLSLSIQSDYEEAINEKINRK